MACRAVDASRTDHAACVAYVRLPLTPLNGTCDKERTVVPRIYHAIGGRSMDFTVRQILDGNPEYRANYHDDDTAVTYLRDKCGATVSDAFRCLDASAYRADLFRFCALFAEGGVYLDADLVPLYPLSQLHLPCRNMSFGHDQPQNGLPGVQMKLLSAVPHHPVARCMIDRIVDHVAWRYVPRSSLYVSGPALLSECVKNHTGNDTYFTHLDSRGAAWPYTGIRTAERLLAFERPKEKRHWMNKDEDYYGAKHGKRSVYTEDCAVAKRPLPAHMAVTQVPTRTLFAGAAWGFGTYDKQAMMRRVSEARRRRLYANKARAAERASKNSR